MMLMPKLRLVVRARRAVAPQIRQELNGPSLGILCLPAVGLSRVHRACGTGCARASERVSSRCCFIAPRYGAGTKVSFPRSVHYWDSMVNARLTRRRELVARAPQAPP